MRGEHLIADLADQPVNLAGRGAARSPAGPFPEMLRALSRLSPMEDSRFTIRSAN